MVEELKIRICGYEQFEEKLIRLGAKFSKCLDVVDTYFHQLPGEVLKITEDDSGDYLVNLKSRNGKFEIAKYEPIQDVEAVKKGLADKFGVKCILRKKRRFFDFENYMININLIEGIGEFLIIEGENLNPKALTMILGLNNPEIVTISFDNLVR